MKLDRCFLNSICLVMSFRVGYQSADGAGQVTVGNTHQFIHLFWAHFAASLNMETGRILSRKMSVALRVGHLSQSGMMQQSITGRVVIAAGTSTRAKRMFRGDAHS